MVTNKDWDTIALINKTDLYGLLNIMLKELGEENNVTDTLNQLKNAINECYQEENDDAYTTLNIINYRGDTLELEGTEKQIEAFEAERKEQNKARFPRGLPFIEVAELALKHGLSVKKVATRK